MRVREVEAALVDDEGEQGYGLWEPSESAMTMNESVAGASAFASCPVQNQSCQGSTHVRGEKDTRQCVERGAQRTSRYPHDLERAPRRNVYEHGPDY